MRVTESIIYRGINSNLGRLNSDIQQLNQQISSGKRLLLPSDDPVGAVSAQAIRGRLTAMDQQKRNCEAWKGWLQSTESAMTETQDEVIIRARELATQMNNSTYSASQRTMAAEEVNNLLEEAVSLGNTQYGGRYIFSGFRDDTKAFEATRNGTGDITAVTYQGDDGHHELKLGPSAKMESSLTGQEAFQGSADVFATLINLRDALRANDPTAIAGTMADLQNCTANFSAKVADVGSKVNRLDLRVSIVADTKLADTDRLSEIEDTDMIEAITALQAKQLNYQAALQAASTTQQLNLASYL